MAGTFGAPPVKQFSASASFLAAIGSVTTDRMWAATATRDQTTSTIFLETKLAMPFKFLPCLSNSSCVNNEMFHFANHTKQGAFGGFFQLSLTFAPNSELSKGFELFINFSSIRLTLLLGYL